MEMFAVLLRSDLLIIDTGHVIDVPYRSTSIRSYVVTSLRVKFHSFVMLGARFDF